MKKNNFQILEPSTKVEDTNSLEEKYENLKQKQGHRRVVSANYNCAKILAKRISTNKEVQEPSMTASKKASTKRQK
jgi:hypothetical protein